MTIASRIRSASLSLAAVLVAVACGGSTDDAGLAGSGGSAGSSAGGSSGASSADCPQAATMLDVAKAPGAGAGYAKAKLTAHCTDTTFVVEGNGMPTYTFVAMTPNPLVEQDHHYEIPKKPVVAAKTTTLPLLGTAGFSVNGMPFFGPNEAAVPAEEAYGDPVYNGLMDPCFGHTANEYHYHSMAVKCLIDSGLVAEPWTNADPPTDKASPIIGYALDGFPIKGSLECVDAGCTKVQEMKSGYDKTGNPKTNAWQAYTWKAHADDASYLDECNGHTGPGGDYHYHSTSAFPYVIGCYRGTPMGAGQMGAGGAGAGGMTGAGGTMGGPKTCASEGDCAGACPPGSKGCTCNTSPMGKVCVPTCSTTPDCPTGTMNALKCQMGICIP